jgi:hypothetical protein
MLRSVLATPLSDIEIPVRKPRIDQTLLRTQMPEAYYTSAADAAGWAEGILGPVDA